MSILVLIPYQKVNRLSWFLLELYKNSKRSYSHAIYKAKIYFPISNAVNFLVLMSWTGNHLIPVTHHIMWHKTPLTKDLYLYIYIVIHREWLTHGILFSPFFCSLEISLPLIEVQVADGVKRVFWIWIIKEWTYG